jgi:hypothetical protein
MTKINHISKIYPKKVKSLKNNNLIDKTNRKMNKTKSSKINKKWTRLMRTKINRIIYF